MELLNNIWSALTTPNETLTSFLTIPLFVVENTLILYLILSLFKIDIKRKLKILYVIISSCISFISNIILSPPINMLFNYISLLLFFYFHHIKHRQSL